MRAYVVVSVLALALPSVMGGCEKARGDDFTHFRGEETLLESGADPRHTLRYRPTPGRDVVYQLQVKRRANPSTLPSRMRLRVALTFPPEGDTSTFSLRLLTLLRMEPTPPGGLPDLGPMHVLLRGRLGPRGALDRLEESSELHSPVNLTLLAPLVLGTFPEAPVGVGATWTVSRRLDWSRQEGADRLIGRTSGFDGHSDLILHTRYKLTREETPGDLPLLHLEGTVEAKIRSRTHTLSHTTQHTGKAQGTLKSTIDKSTGIPEKVTLSLDGSYSLRANDQTRPLKEHIALSLTRE